MLPDFKFHHIGYITNNIESTSLNYSAAGYKASEIVIDTFQNVKVCFLTKKGNPRIELIEPIDEYSSVNKILKKLGVTPYHVCYEVENINTAYDALCRMGYIPLFRPIEAIALRDKLICFMYKKEVGYIELLNS